MLPLAAFAGALLAIALVLCFALWGRWQNLDHFILSGVAVSFLFSAITGLLLYQHDPFAANRVMFWLMGSLSRASYQPLWFILPCLLLCLLLSVLFRRQLDAGGAPAHDGDLEHLGAIEPGQQMAPQLAVERLGLGEVVPVRQPDEDLRERQSHQRSRSSTPRPMSPSCTWVVPSTIVSCLASR